jgi:hypothetical protein
MLPDDDGGKYQNAMPMPAAEDPDVAPGLNSDPDLKGAADDAASGFSGPVRSWHDSRHAA